MFLPLLQSAARLLLVAAVLADLSGIMAVVSGSVYMAYGIPFAGYYLLTILHERYLESVYVIDPQSWIKGAGDWGKVFNIAGVSYSGIVWRTVIWQMQRTLIM